MAARFTYSRWDGTQQGFDLDADALFDELNDDLLYHGDINSALRRLMQQGMNDRNGERMQELRELMEKLARNVRTGSTVPIWAACTRRSPTSSTTSSTRSATQSRTPPATRSAAATNAVPRRPATRRWTATSASTCCRTISPARCVS
ncbi:MAG: hypothetical protein R2713_18160 [Ilumatobacteraceae bacterium]